METIHSPFDSRAMVVGAVVFAVIGNAAWFGRLPMGAFALVLAGPFVAGYLADTLGSGAFEGAGAGLLGSVLAFAGFTLGMFWVFRELELQWQIDMAFVTFGQSILWFGLLSVPAIIGGGVAGWLGQALRTAHRQGVTID